MGDLAPLLQQHRVITLEALGALLLITAVFSGMWVRQGLREGVTWMGYWWRPRRDDTPALYWIVIAGHSCMTALLALFGLTLLAWGLVEVL